MAGGFHECLVIHRHGAYSINHGTQTPPKIQLQLSIASDKGATSRISGMALVRFSERPHKPMRLDHDTENSRSSVENRDDVTQVHVSNVRFPCYHLAPPQSSYALSRPFP